VASELRWILAAISVPLLIGIWWWGTRRSRQAPGNAELRESTAAPGASPARTSGAFDDESDAVDPQAGPRNWGVPPFEPLTIRTADFDHVPGADMSMTARPEAAPEHQSSDTDPREVMLAVPAAPATPAAPPSTPAASPHEAAAAATPAAGTVPVDASATGRHPEVPNVSETQRIVAVRVSAMGERRWIGSQVMAALEDHGLAYGRYQVFHRRHSDGRTLFCAASLAEPGTFNLARMPQEEFRGLTLFAVLPGPAEPLQTLDALIQTAGALAETLQGIVQDSKGVPLSTQRALALRDDVAQFQAKLTMS